MTSSGASWISCESLANRCCWSMLTLLYHSVLVQIERPAFATPALAFTSMRGADLVMCARCLQLKYFSFKSSQRESLKHVPKWGIIMVLYSGNIAILISSIQKPAVHQSFAQGLPEPGTHRWIFILQKGLMDPFCNLADKKSSQAISA